MTKGLPDYLNAELDQTMLRIRQASDPDALRFVFITDLHYSPGGNQLYAAEAVRRLSRAFQMDAVVVGGDNAFNASRSEVLIAQREIVSELSSASCPLFVLKGNHDDNSLEGAEETLFPETSYELYVKPVERYVNQDNGNPLGLYYYVDFEEKKTRLIMLNCIDIPYRVLENGELAYDGQSKYAFSNRQLNWLAHSALDLSGKPDRRDWAVILFSHVSMNQNQVFGIDYHIQNGGIAWGIVTAFQNGGGFCSAPTQGDFAQQVEVDYSSQPPGCVKAIFFGHVHFDQVVVQNGIPLISTLNATTYRDFEEAPERIPGTVSETAFDVVTINRKRGQIVLTRFGAGEDRSVDLSGGSQP